MFTQRFASVPSFSVDQLLQLSLSSDEQKKTIQSLISTQKAAQEAAKAAQEAQDALKGEVEKFVQLKDLARYEQEKADKERQLREQKFEEAKALYLKKKEELERQEVLLTNDQAEVARLFKEAADKIKAADAYGEEVKNKWELTLQVVKDENIALAQREAAVAAREAKAEALAKLLKEV